MEEENKVPTIDSEGKENLNEQENVAEPVSKLILLKQKIESDRRVLLEKHHKT